MNSIGVLLHILVAFGAQTEAAGAVETPVTVKLLGSCVSEPKPATTFSARITTKDLIDLVSAGELGMQFELAAHREATTADLQRVALDGVVARMESYLKLTLDDRYDPERDVIRTEVPAAHQVSVDTPDLASKTFTGPAHEVTGFLMHDVTKDEFVEVAVRVIQVARQLLDSGDPAYDRTDPGYYRALAERDVAALRAAQDAEEAEQQARAAARARIAEGLGLTPTADGFDGEPDWFKESRRFSYIVREGRFIQRLQPLVERINRDMDLAGFSPPDPLDRPGIYYDPEIGDVDIVLPKPTLVEFLAQADAFERRMAEDAVISIEAVRLTDRDIMAGALAARLNAQVQGVHDVRRFRSSRIFRELGLNALLAVANQNLQIRTLQAIAGGDIPEGVAPVQVATPTLPPIDTTASNSTVGSTFSFGADPIFFDGREQRYGFSYISPDGIEHTLDLEVVDSLRETWSRIERNLIVHKIKKTDGLTPFSVPVGPDTKTYDGIAALISQENQQLIVATGTGAISEISATAGTWLVIKDFDIAPIPGSSTALTEEEREDIESKVLLTMFLRDPSISNDFKRQLVMSGSREKLRRLLQSQFDECRARPIHRMRGERTYVEAFNERHGIALEEQRYTKREENSVISLTFYSSQGNIVQAPGTTQLGDANDLTAFTTELRPNEVTPISSFFTKSGNATFGTSPLTGLDKGEQRNEDKSMTHLLIRSRFPTAERENRDRDEGRFTGYFALPMGRQPSSEVDMPFLSSSDHPAVRLARLRLGLMFEILDHENVRAPFAGFNPNRFPGSVTREVWETATTRMLMCRKLITDSPGADESMAADYGERFILEVRTLLEYDEDFFDSPQTALRNMTQWNDPDRIVLALNNSPGRFALERLVLLLDELGEKLVPDHFAHNYLAISPPAGFSDRRIYPLSERELLVLRRDVAAHYLRFREYYGDAFLEAVSNVFDLGTYRSMVHDDLLAGPLRGYHDLVVFDTSGRGYANPHVRDEAHRHFLFLKDGGYKGKLFEPSMLSLEHLNDDERAVIYRGKDILALIARSVDEQRYVRN